MTQPPPTPPPLPARVSFVPSAVVYLLLFTAVGCWQVYASVLFADFGVSLAVIGLLASVPAAVAIVGAPSWGLVADRLGDVRPPLLVAALLAAAVASLLVPAARACRGSRSSWSASPRVRRAQPAPRRAHRAAAGP